MQLNGKKVIWIGDINIDQRNLTVLQFRKFYISMKIFGMIQVVTRRSYRNGVLSESTVDVVMTNCYSDFTKCEALNYRIGEHETLKTELNFKVPKADKFKCVSIRDHSEQNIESLHYYLKELSDYTDIMTCENLDAAVDGFSHHVNNVYEKFCPVRIIKCKNNYLFNPSKELLKNIIQKEKLTGNRKKLK